MKSRTCVLDTDTSVFLPAAAGTLIGPMDLLIAATVRSLGATLVTNNVREFSRVTGLDVENWME